MRVLRILTRANIVFGAAGDVDAAQLKSVLEKRLHGLSPGEAWPLPEAPAAVSGGRAILTGGLDDRSAERQNA